MVLELSERSKALPVDLRRRWTYAAAGGACTDLSSEFQDIRSKLQPIAQAQVASPRVEVRKSRNDTAAMQELEFSDNKAEKGRLNPIVV